MASVSNWLHHSGLAVCLQKRHLIFSMIKLECVSVLCVIGTRARDDVTLKRPPIISLTLDNPFFRIYDLAAFALEGKFRTDLHPVSISLGYACTLLPDTQSADSLKVGPQGQ